MSMKRVVGAAAVAASVGIAAVTVEAGLAHSAPYPPVPLDPTSAPPQPTGGGQTPKPTQAPQPTAATPKPTQAPQPTGATPKPTATTAQPTATTPKPTATTPQPTATTTPQPTATTTTPQPTATTTTPQSTPQPTGTTTPSTGATTSPGGATTPQPTGQSTTVPAGSTTNPTTPAKPGITVVLNPPSIQPPHPPYIPRVALVLPGVTIGGPTDTLAGFSVVGQGGPPPPPQRGWGWNDGPAPGHPPPNWSGPPPNGSWDGPPPPGGWNRPWNGPARDVGYARNDFGAFNYNTFTVTPVFNWQYGGWGYWFFGVWVPLY